ncbi:MAG TPA: DUF1634 domain-containing protein [Candidatus Binataceae bacterium]|nr:DUF1634 domain-containing protein [Candidatus Binataceae bacterium]
MPEFIEHSAQSADEDRIMRVWTPMLLRTILIVATIILVTGLVMMATHAPGYFAHRYHTVQSGRTHDPQTFAQLIEGATQGDPHSVMTVGLFALTLVPLARVAFCFLLFVKERDFAYVGFTAYVLIGLITGMLLGRIG